MIYDPLERKAAQTRALLRQRERYRANSQRYRDKKDAERKAKKQAAIRELERLVALESQPIPKTPIRASVYLPPPGSLALSLLQGRI